MTETALTVTQALVQVSKEVDAIAKSKTTKAQGAYKYRGIEDVLSALHDPFIKYGVLVVPRARGESVMRKVTAKDGAERVEYEAQMDVEYRIYGPAGDYIDATIFATGLDSGDKATGKAISYAYKQLMFQLLCIPTDAAQDNEASSPAPSAAARPAAQEGHGQDSPRWQAVRERLRAMDAEKRKPVIHNLVVAGLFEVTADGNIPKLPYSVADMTKVEGLVPFPVPAAVPAPAPVAPAPEVTDTLSPAHPDHAVETMKAALNVAELPEDIDPAYWYLCEMADVDTIDWKAAAKALNITGKAVLDAAKKIAGEAELDMPERLDDIHGILAHEVRAHFIAGAMAEPY